MKQDKIMHIVVAVALTALLGLPTYFGSWNDATETYSLFSGLWATVFGGTMLAACKEWCDNNYSFGKWDWRDFGCSLIGVLAVAGLIMCIHFCKG